jgi:flagellar protein FlgJ
VKIENGISLKPLSPEAKLEKQEKQLRDAAKMYENHFLNQMVKAMRSTVGGEDGLVKRNMAEKIFTEQLDQKYVDGWSDKGGVGLADMIYDQIKEKYMGAATGRAVIPKGGLPIAPTKAQGMPATDSIQMKAIPPSADNQLKYRFEVQNPSGDGFEVQAPMGGRISEVRSLDQGWSTVKVDHGHGLKSEMTFPGRLSQNAVGGEVRSGQTLGVLDSARPVVAWNLDWT